MSTPVVGIWGATGNVGSLTLPHLLKAHSEGKIKLVILHRHSTKLPEAVSQTSGVEARAINTDGPLPELTQALQGIQTLLSMVGAEGGLTQINLLEALAKSPDFVTFIPNTFGSPLTEEKLADSPPLADMVLAAERKAKELGLSFTKIHAGAFSLYFFGYNFLGTNVKENVVQANQKQLKNPVAITTLEYLAAGLAWLVTKPPSELKNKQLVLIDQWVTGDELVEALEKVHGGKKPEIKDWSEADIATMKVTPPYGPVQYHYLVNWGNGKDSWGYGEEVVPPGWKKESLEDVIKRYI